MTESHFRPLPRMAGSLLSIFLKHRNYDMKDETHKQKKIKALLSSLLDDTRRGELAAVVKCLSAIERSPRNESKINAAINAAFMIALEEGHQKIVEYLVSNEAVPLTGFLGNELHTALLIVASKGHKGIAQWLFENHRAKLGENERSLVGLWSPLLVASKNGWLPMVELLLDNKASITERGHGDGQSALHLAAEGGHVHVVRHLVEKRGSSVHERYAQEELNWTPFLSAAWYGHVPVMQYLLASDHSTLSECDAKGNTALMLAARNGQLEAVQWFFHNPAINRETPAISLRKKNTNGLNYFLLAVSGGRLSVVRWLLAKDGGGINFLEANHEHTKTALDLAKEKKDSVMEAFLKGYLAEKLIESAEKNDYQNLFLWKKYGASLKTHGENRLRPIYVTIEKDHLECIKEFVELKADFSAVSESGDTRLQLAVKAGSWRVANYFSLLDKSSTNNIIECALIALVKSALLDNFNFIMMSRVPTQNEQAKIIALSQIAIIQLPENKYDIGFCSETHGYIQRRLPEAFLPDIEIKMEFKNTPLPLDRRDFLAQPITAFILSQNGWAPRTQNSSLDQLKKASEILAHALKSHLIEEEQFYAAQQYRNFLFYNKFSNIKQSWEINNVILFLIGKVFITLSKQRETLRSKEQMLEIAKYALEYYCRYYPNDLDCQENLNYIKEILAPIQEKIKPQRINHAGQMVFEDSLHYYNHDGQVFESINPDNWFIAVASGNLGAMTRIASRVDFIGVDTVVDFLGCSDLMVAIENKWPQVIEWLLERGADLNRKNLLGVTPLKAAEKIGDRHILKICMNRLNKLAMCRAIESGSMEQVEHFVFHKKVNPITFDSKFIEINIKESDLTKKTLYFLKLMQTKLLPLVQDLHGSIASHDIKAVQTCLTDLDEREKRFVVSSSDFSRNSKDAALHCAIFVRNWNIFKILLECNSDLEVEGEAGRTVFVDFIACDDFNGKLEYINLLLSKNIMIDARAQEGNTALHYAVINDWVLGMKRLLQEKTNPNIRAICDESDSLSEYKVNNGLSVLECAIVCFKITRNFSILDLLMKAVSIDSINSGNPVGGNTALHYAAQYATIEEYVEIIQSLLNRGAFVCKINTDGQTPLDILNDTIGKEKKSTARIKESNILAQQIKEKIDFIESSCEDKDSQHKIKKKFLSTLVSQDESLDILTIHHGESVQTVETKNTQKLWQYASKNKTPTQVAVIFREIATTLDTIHKLNFSYPTLDSLDVFFRLDEKSEISAVKIIAFDRPQPLNEQKMFLPPLELLNPFNSPQFISRCASKDDILGISEDYYRFALLLYKVLFEAEVPTQEQIENRLKQDARYKEFYKRTDPDHYAIQYTEALFHIIEEQYKKINFSDKSLPDKIDESTGIDPHKKCVIRMINKDLSQDASMTLTEQEIWIIKKSGRYEIIFFDKIFRKPVQQPLNGSLKTPVNPSDSKSMVTTPLETEQLSIVGLTEKMSILTAQRDLLHKLQPQKAKELDHLIGLMELQLKVFSAQSLSPEVQESSPAVLPNSSTYIELRVPGDGHCFYTAVGLYLGRDQKELRGWVADELKSNSDAYDAFRELKTGQKSAEYLAGVRSSQWAGHVEIIALMNILKRPIIVVYPGENPEKRVQHPNRARGEDKYYGIGAPILVKYNGRNHYDALVLIENSAGSHKFSGMGNEKLVSLLDDMSQEGVIDQAPIREEVFRFVASCGGVTDYSDAIDKVAEAGVAKEDYTFTGDLQEQVFKQAFDLIRQLLLAKTMTDREKIDLLSHPFLMKGRERGLSDVSTLLNSNHLLVSASRSGAPSASSSESDSAVLKF